MTFLRSLTLGAAIGHGTLIGLLLLPGCAVSQVADAGDPLIDKAVVADAPLSPSPLGHYLAGLHATAEHDFSAAADLMAYALESNPNDPELLRSTYSLMASAGRMAEAAALAKRLEAVGGDSATAALTLALEQVKAGHPQAADDELAKQPTDGINQFAVPMLRAWLALELKGPDAALAALSPLGGIKGFQPLYHLHTALLNDAGGRAAAAKQAYLDTVADAQEPSLRLVALFGNFYQRQGQPDEARALYDRFAKQSPGSLRVDPLVAALDKGKSVPPVVGSAKDGIAEALFNLASVLHQEDATDMALVFTRMALDLKPDFPIAQVLLGDILITEHRTTEALAVYRAVPPDSSVGWQAQLAVPAVLEDDGQTDEAVKMLRAMVEQRPSRPEAAVQLGNLLRSHERFAEAAKAYDTAVARIGDLKPQDWSLLYFRGITRERSNQWAGAQADFLKALELSPDHPYVLNYLAYSWVEKGENYDKALAMLRKAVKERPEDGYIVDSLGWVLYRLGKYDDAVKYLEQAVQLRPQDATINDHLGDAYWKVGRRSEARFQWRRALNFKPEADQVGIIQAKIDHGLKSASGS